MAYVLRRKEASDAWKFNNLQTVLISADSDQAYDSDMGSQLGRANTSWEHEHVVVENKIICDITAWLGVAFKQQTGLIILLQRKNLSAAYKN